jgi:hypothetical protein
MSVSDDPGRGPCVPSTDKANLSDALRRLCQPVDDSRWLKFETLSGAIEAFDPDKAVDARLLGDSLDGSALWQTEDGRYIHEIPGRTPHELTPRQASYLLYQARVDLLPGLVPVISDPDQDGAGAADQPPPPGATGQATTPSPPVVVIGAKGYSVTYNGITARVETPEAIYLRELLDAKGNYVSFKKRFFRRIRGCMNRERIGLERR